MSDGAPAGGPDDSVNAQALARVNAWLDRYFPTRAGDAK